MSSHSDSFVGSGSSPTRRNEVPFPFEFLLENCGSIFLIHPQNEHAVAWLNENIGQNNGFQPYWPTVVIDHRFVTNIIAGIRADGLDVEL